MVKQLLKGISIIVLPVLSTLVHASIITIEVDSIIDSNYTLYSDASSFRPVGGVYNQFAIGDIFTTKYSFDSEAVTECTGALLVCTFETGALVEFYGDKNNLGTFSYSSLDTILKPKFTKDSSIFIDDYFSFDHEIFQNTGFLTDYNYKYARTSFGGFDVNLSNIFIGENNLGSMLNGISISSWEGRQGVNINFFNDIVGEIGIIGTKINGDARVNKIPEPFALAIFTLGIIGLGVRRFKK
ncbi:MAG: hypothetical protein ACI9YE_001438 [Psychroserpens sp.]|jgi:hypothetical protein